MSRRRFLQCLAVTVLTAAILGQPAVLTAQPGNVVPGSFICLVDDSEDAFTIGQAAVEATGGILGHVYRHALNGFSIQVPPGIVMANLRAQRGIIHVEPDLVMYASEMVIPTGVDRIDAEGVLAAGIDCSGIGIAIIDTGIQSDHPDLNVVGGRHFYTVNTGPPRSRGGHEDDNWEDGRGHGTHVAGIAAANGNIIGVAPGARLFAVKVLGTNGLGDMSDVIAGVNWVAANAAELEIHIANMSLGTFGTSDALYEAMSNTPVVFTVSAGNEGEDIGVYGQGRYRIPAAYGRVLGNVYTISAMVDTDGKPGGFGPPTSHGPDDSFASFSNYSAADGIAYILPGVNIYSTWINSGYRYATGTSMAAPHAAGLRALQLAVGETATRLVGQDDLEGLIQPSGDPDGQYEPLLYANYPLDAPLAVRITEPADGATISGKVTIIATASSNVTAVKFVIDQQSIQGSWQGDLWTATWDTTDLSGAWYTITAKATDGSGDTATHSINVYVDNTPGEPPATISVSITDQRSYWQNPVRWVAEVDVSVTAEDSLVGGAIIHGTFEPGGSVSAETNEYGVCTFISDTLHRNVTSTTFTVDYVVINGEPYFSEVLPSVVVYSP